MDDHGSGPPGGPGDEIRGADMVRMTFWIERWVDERLRKKAFATGETEAGLVREALRRYFDEE